MLRIAGRPRRRAGSIHSRSNSLQQRRARPDEALRDLSGRLLRANSALPSDQRRAVGELRRRRRVSFASARGARTIGNRRRAGVPRFRVFDCRSGRVYRRNGNSRLQFPGRQAHAGAFDRRRLTSSSNLSTRSSTVGQRYSRSTYASPCSPSSRRPALLSSSHDNASWNSRDER